jgi:hypothetical protein
MRKRVPDEQPSGLHSLTLLAPFPTDEFADPGQKVLTACLYLPKGKKHEYKQRAAVRH